MHTPGPWFTETLSPIGHCAIVDADGFTIADPSPMGQDNARLIAAAPDMLEALRAMVDYFGQHPDVDNGLDETLTAARAAIARATGIQ